MDWEPAVGMRVVCVQDDWCCQQGEAAPRRNKVYTIREVTAYGPHVGLRLREIVNAPRHYIESFGECYFGCQFFRPLEEKKTDISVFQRLLVGASVRESESLTNHTCLSG